MKLAGVDLGWKAKGTNSAVAIGELQKNRFCITDVITSLTVDEVTKALFAHSNIFGLGIDAPLIINNYSGQRTCERLLSSDYGNRKASCHSSNLTHYPDPTGVDLAKKLLLKGYSHACLSDKFIIECYPHPTIIEIFGLSERILYKKGKVSIRRYGQKYLAKLISKLSKSLILMLDIPDNLRSFVSPAKIDNLKGKSLKENEDALDSIICAYTAALFKLNLQSQTFGNKQDGYIYVPQIHCI
ncbi:MAG: DUF429 domain-containing protein [Planctomycetes bacterium]|nr:DUF429 domain-containing protein [Planctomycetota bacterium]